MATPSEVKVALDAVAVVINRERIRLGKAQNIASESAAILNDLPTEYADVVATIQAYAGGDPFEDAVTAELAALTAEFVALRMQANVISAVDLEA